MLPEGSEGELVFTTLTKEALPVIRYRTRDLTRLLPPTARSMRRMGKIVGRSDDMLIIRGVNVFPTQIEASAAIDAVDIYGLSEVMGPGVASECVETKDGPVIWEDHFYPEIIDPATGAVLPDGSEGELVFTSLTKEALPIIRYRTRDLTRLLPPTARSFRRMGKIVGRSDDMLIIRGVNVFPTQIEEIVLQHPQLSGQYQLVVGREGPLDTLTVRTELNLAGAQASPAEIAEITHWLQHRIKTLVGVSTSIDVLAPDSIERTLTGKARRVLDQRSR